MMSEPRYAQGPEDFPTVAEMRAMTGLEFMQKLMTGELPTATIAKQMGYRVTQVKPGLVELRGRPEFTCTNAFGGVHGGWYATVLDTCMTCAVISALPRGCSQTTLEFKVNMLRALPLGTEFTAVGTTDHVGRSTGVARGEIRGAEDGRLYAVGTATCFIMCAPE